MTQKHPIAAETIRTRGARLGLLLLLLGTAAGIQPALADLPPKPRQEVSQNPQVKQLMAQAAKALQQGNIALATIQLKNALRLDPNNGAVRALLGSVILQTGDVISAERELKLARGAGARDTEVVPALLQAMLANKENNDLLAQFPEPAAGDKSPLAATILRARAMALQGIGNTADAVSAIDRSLTIVRDVSGLLTRAEIALLQLKQQDALKYIDQALAMAPNNPNAMMMKAAVLRFSDKKAALAILDTLAKAHPGDLRANVARIEILVELNQYDEAQKTVDAILAQSPDLPVANFYKAVLLGVRGKPQDGWRIAQSLTPEFIQSDPRVAIGVSQLAINSGNLESANALLSGFVVRNPAVLEPRLRLAALRIKMNNGSGALETLTPVMNSQDARTLELIAAAYEKTNQHDESLAYMRKAVVAGSTSVAVKFQIAQADIQQGNTQKGVQGLLDLLRQEPNNLAGPGMGIELLLKLGKVAEAQTVIDQADKLNPKSPLPPYFRGMLQIAQRKPDMGLNAFSQSLGRDPNYPPSLFARAELYVAQKKLKEATADVERVRDHMPNDPLPYIKLGEIAALSGQQAQATSLLKTAIAKAPKAVDARLVLARYQVALKQNDAAKQTLKDVLQVQPGNAAALALMGNVQQRLGEKAAAVDTNKQLTQKYQQSGAAQFLLANSMLGNGDKKGAVTALKRAIELSPDVIQYRTALISAQIAMGDNDGAVATAKGWADLHKGPDGAVMVVETLFRLKRVPEAAAAVEKAKADKPDWRLTLLDSQISQARGNDKRAISLLKDWLSDHSTDLAIRQAYASGLMRQGDNAAALQQYELVLKSQGDIPEALNNVAWLIKDSAPARALSLASKAWQLSPNSADVADTYGFLLLRKGDANGAMPVLQRAHALGPDNGDISFHFAQALTATGKKADAKAVLQAALAKNSKFASAPDAKKLMQSL
jgi:putative PEP-CTERM system TPR-repeat lipoprotein